MAATLLRPGLEEKLGQEVVMQHRPGGGGSVGWTMLTQQKPDGYMMAITNLPHIVVQPLKTKGISTKPSNWHQSISMPNHRGVSPLPTTVLLTLSRTWSNSLRQTPRSCPLAAPANSPATI